MKKVLFLSSCFLVLIILLSEGATFTANAISIDDIYTNALENARIKYLNNVFILAIVQVIVLFVCAVIRYSHPPKNINVFLAFIPFTLILIKTAYFFGAIYWILLLIEFAILALLRRLSFFSTPEKLLEIEKKEINRIIDKEALFSDYFSFDKSIIIESKQSFFDPDFWKSEFRKDTSKRNSGSTSTNTNTNEHNSKTEYANSREQSSETEFAKTDEHSSETESVNTDDYSSDAESTNSGVKQDCYFSNYPKSFSSTFTSPFTVSFKGIKPGDYISWQSFGNLRLIKAEFEIKDDLNAIAEFRYEFELKTPPMLAIIVKYRDNNYILNYINEGDSFVITK